MKIQVVGVLFRMGLFASTTADVNIILNGSFETPTAPIGNFTNFPVGSGTLTNWTVTGPAGAEVSIVSGTFTQNGVSFPAEDGAQWLDLTGDGSNSTEGISQVVATTAGDQYQLAYWIGNTTGGGIFGSTSTVKVSLNGVSAFGDTNSNVSPTTLNWQQFTHNFTATGSSTTLGFQNGDPPGDNSNGLDNIVLIDLGPAPPAGVPGPASSGLVAFGLALSAVFLKKRS